MQNTALFAELQGAGYDGGYSTVTDFVRAWRAREGQAALFNAFVPLALKATVIDHLRELPYSQWG